MSRVKRVLGTILGILFIAAVVWGVVSGCLEDIKGPRRCSENYAECVGERIQVVLAASTVYASWLDAVVLNVSAVRACHRAVAGEYYFFDDVKPPASCETIHLRLLEALKEMETLTRVTAGQLDVFPDPAAHKGFVGRREANIMKCQQELREIQEEILKLGSNLGWYGDDQERSLCALDYPECAQERIQVALEVSTYFLSSMDMFLPKKRIVRENNRRLNGVWVVLNDIGPPAPYEAIHARLLAALRKMVELTYVSHLSSDSEVIIQKHIRKCQEELRQIQAEILQLSGGGIETPHAQEVTPAAVIPATVTPSRATITYTVQSGDTVAKIAARFGVTVEQMVASNDIEDPNLVEVGQVLVIPSP